MKMLRNYILEQVVAGALTRDRAAQMLAELVAQPSATVSISSPHQEIAIVGMACRFPPYDNLEGFWASLAAGTDLVRPFPEARRQDINALAEHLEKVSPDLARCFKRPFFEAAYLDRIDLFDYAAFRISPEEARLLDPQQRLLLEVVQMCLANAGYSREMLNGSKTGVYIAYADSEYAQLIPHDHPSAIHATLPAMLAGRISYLFNWRGPSQVIETTCSSSLVALHNACQALLAGDCEAALVGGVQILLFPFAETYADFEQIGIRSADGRTRTFDSAANGTGNGEGVGLVMLKPLAQAMKDGDYIHAVIKGSAINSDGRSSGVTAPNPEAQAQVIVDAWLKAGIDPTTISYIEAHGTATRLGDPIEIQGITSAFRQYTDRQAFCAIGSVKTNLGHLNAAAGIAGLIKTVLALKHRQIPPSLHFQTPNPLIPFDDSPVFVNDTLRSWHVAEGLRRAGVSAFGLSGTNCHVILEEASEQTAVNEPYRPSGLMPRRCWLPAETGAQALLISAYGVLPEKYMTPLVERLPESVDRLKWLYTANWIEEPLITPVASANMHAGTWLLLVDELGFGTELSRQLSQAGCETIVILPGACFQQRSEHEYQVRPASQADWEQVFQQLALVKNLKLAGVVHLWTCRDLAIRETLDEGIEQQNTGVLSLFALCQQIVKVPICKPFAIWVVSNFVQRVTGHEEALFPDKASLWGLSRVIPQEYYWVQCFCLDVGTVHQERGEVSTLIFNEMFQDLARRDYTIVYRQGQRFVQQLERVKLANFVDREQPVVKEGGVYLLAGGTGYIGLGLARYLAQQAHVNLVLLSRTPLPERETWSYLLASQAQDRMASCLQAITEIEKLGSEVLHLAADIGDQQVMIDVIDHVLQRYGQINGVINATMQLQEQRIEELRQEDFAFSVFNRLRGAYVLDQVTRDRKLDFFIIISSLSSHFGGVGQADDVSANLFLDAYGAWMEHRGQEVSVLNLPRILDQNPASLTVGERILPAISRADLLELFALLSRKRVPFVMIENFDFQEIRQVLPLLKVRFAAELLAGEISPTRLRPENLFREVSADAQMHNGTLEQQIAGIWSNVLGYPEIELHENFFDLGGDSLIAMRIVERLQQIYDLHVVIADLFKHPTIADLADYIKQRPSSSYISTQPPEVESLSRSPEETYAQGFAGEQIAQGNLPRVWADESGDAPLSFIQEKLWFLDQLMPGTTVNNVALAYHLKGPLDLHLLVRSLNELIQRHDILHTVFITEKDQPVQRVVSAFVPELEIVDLQALTEQEQSVEVSQIATTTLLQPFDLAHGPLLRGKLVTLNENEHIMALAVHHIVFDGWSVGIFLRELATIYEAFSQGRPSPLPPLPFQYADFARSQRQRLHGQALAEQVAFWRQRLAGATALELPTDFARSNELSFQGEIQPIIIPSAVVQKLQQLSEQEHATLFVTLLTAFFALLRLYAQQDDLVIGVASANRTGPGANKLIGAFVNTLIMRVDCTDTSSFRKLLARVRQVVLEVSEHQALTFEQILEAIDPHNPLGTPLIRVVFNFYTNPLQEVNFLGMPLTPIEIEKKAERYDLSLELTDDGEQGISGFISYNVSIFKSTTIARMAKQLETFLRNVASEPEMDI